MAGTLICVTPPPLGDSEKYYGEHCCVVFLSPVFWSPGDLTILPACTWLSRVDSYFLSLLAM